MSGKPTIELTRAQRRAIIDGDWPHIPLTPEQAKAVEPHELVVILHRVWLIVKGAKRDKKAGWYLDYIGRDDRPRLLRQSPHAVDYTEIRKSFDSAGVPRKVNEQDGEEAEEESHYTAVHHLAVPELAGEPFEAVPVEYQTVITMNGRRNHVEKLKAERVEELARDDVRRLAAHTRELVIRATRMGVDPVPIIARLERELRAVENEMAEQKVA